MYRCQCIDCGFIKESETHCNELRCEKCSGQMRRSDRPGVGVPRDGIVRPGVGRR